MKSFALFLALAPLLAFANLSIDNAPANPVLYNPSAPEKVVEDLFVKNNSAKDITVQIVRIQNDTAPGHETYFCWYICHGSGNNGPFGNHLIPAGGSNASSFTVHLTPKGRNGTTTVTFRAFDQANPNVKAEITIVFSDGTYLLPGVDLAALLAPPAPNPAAEITTLAYELPADVSAATLSLISADGREAQRTTLPSRQGTAELDLRALPAGLYTLRLRTAEGRLLGTRRLAVAR